MRCSLSSIYLKCCCTKRLPSCITVWIIIIHLFWNRHVSHERFARHSSNLTHTQLLTSATTPRTPPGDSGERVPLATESWPLLTGVFRRQTVVSWKFSGRADGGDRGWGSWTQAKQGEITAVSLLTEFNQPLKEPTMVQIRNVSIL